MGLVNRILTANFADCGVIGIEEVVIKMKVYDIFESNFDLEKICDELTEYLGDDERLSHLVPEIKKHYINSFQ